MKNNPTFERVFVAGHRGMVGSAICRRMAQLALPEPLVASREDLDLLNQQAVNDFIAAKKPTSIIVAAAKVGGIEANRTHPADFLYQNLVIATHIINAAYQNGVTRVLYLGSSCIYPRMSPQPMPESALLTGPLEPTNEGYAIAKIAGMKLCQYYRKQYGALFHCGMPTNLYGPGDNYDLQSSHVLPALLRKFEAAREAGDTSMPMWGTGVALREFLHVDDLADAVLFLMTLPNPPDWVNIGSGREVSIKELAEMVRDACGAKCELVWDPSKPDGMPRKLLNCSLLHSLGWRPKISLEEGIRRTVQDYRMEKATGTLRIAR